MLEMDGDVCYRDNFEGGKVEDVDLLAKFIREVGDQERSAC